MTVVDGDDSCHMPLPRARLSQWMTNVGRYEGKVVWFNNVLE
jgi:hypothetical protein